jgi:hypothetical protein
MRDCFLASFVTAQISLAQRRKTPDEVRPLVALCHLQLWPLM